MTARKIGIIGIGKVGGALAKGLRRAGHEVRGVGKEKQGVRDTADWGEVIILAVPFGALPEVAETVGGAVDGKVVVDVSNALDADRNLALGFTTSGAEELQRRLPRAYVVKAFNTVFASTMETGRLGDERLSAFAAADDASARSTVLALAGDIGFDAIDAGPLRNARLLEPLGYLNIQLAFAQGLGPQIGFKLVRR